MAINHKQRNMNFLFKKRFTVGQEGVLAEGFPMVSRDNNEGVVGEPLLFQFFAKIGNQSVGLINRPKIVPIKVAQLLLMLDGWGKKLRIEVRAVPGGL